MTETILRIGTAEPDILSKIKNYIESLEIDVEEEDLEYDPYTLTEEDLIHIAKGLDDIKNGRTIPSEEVHRKALENLKKYENRMV
ncbi:MAG: hypothetical protein LBE36_11870 [Flavobacteriaceae bacterium]|jgi:uncharacterized OsmC-like protein|nr:hypothetical protein [Flavobacteriaceae bacterium]